MLCSKCKLYPAQLPLRPICQRCHGEQLLANFDTVMAKLREKRQLLLPEPRQPQSKEVTT